MSAFVSRVGDEYMYRAANLQVRPRHIFFALLLMGMFLLVASLAGAEQYEYNVLIYVQDRYSQPVENATVIITGISLGYGQICITDRNGTTEAQLPPGKYYINASKGGETGSVVADVKSNAAYTITLGVISRFPGEEEAAPSAPTQSMTLMLYGLGIIFVIAIVVIIVSVRKGSQPAVGRAGRSTRARTQHSNRRSRR